MATKAAEILQKTDFEERFFDVDWTDELDSGETISSATITVTAQVGSTGAVVASNITISGAKVQAKYTGGTNGNDYDVLCKITTSTQKREVCNTLKVRAPC